MCYRDDVSPIGYAGSPTAAWIAAILASRSAVVIAIRPLSMPNSPANPRSIAYITRLDRLMETSIVNTAYGISNSISVRSESDSPLPGFIAHFAAPILRCSLRVLISISRTSRSQSVFSSRILSLNSSAAGLQSASPSPQLYQKRGVPSSRLYSPLADSKHSSS